MYVGRDVEKASLFTITCIGGPAAGTAAVRLRLVYKHTRPTAAAHWTLQSNEKVTDI